MNWFTISKHDADCLASGYVRTNLPSCLRKLFPVDLVPLIRHKLKFRIITGVLYDYNVLIERNLLNSVSSKLENQYHNMYMCDKRFHLNNRIYIYKFEHLTREQYKNGILKNSLETLSECDAEFNSIILVTYKGKIFGCEINKDRDCKRMTTFKTYCFEKCLKNDFMKRYHIVTVDVNSPNGDTIFYTKSKLLFLVQEAFSQKAISKHGIFNGIIIFTDHCLNTVCKNNLELSVDIAILPRAGRSKLVLGMSFGIGLIGIELNALNDYFKKQNDNNYFNFADFVWNDCVAGKSIIFNTLYFFREDRFCRSKDAVDRDNNIKFRIKYVGIGKDVIDVKINQLSDTFLIRGIIIAENPNVQTIRYKLHPKYVYFYFIIDMDTHDYSKEYMFRVQENIKNKE